MKSDETPCINYAELESLIKIIDNCKNKTRIIFNNKNR